MTIKAMKRQTQLSEHEMRLNTLEDEITEALEAAIGDLAEDKDFRLNEIQPPTSIVRAAAVAAAQVLMGFERGYLIPKMEEPE